MTAIVVVALFLDIATSQKKILCVEEKLNLNAQATALFNCEYYREIVMGCVRVSE
jgi:hypothetical protein